MNTKLSPERLAERERVKKELEAVTLRPYLFKGYYFLANKEDAKLLGDVEPFRGERYEQPTKENGLEQATRFKPDVS